MGGKETCGRLNAFSRTRTTTRTSTIKRPTGRDAHQRDEPRYLSPDEKDSNVRGTGGGIVRSTADSGQHAPSFHRRRSCSGRRYLSDEGRRQLYYPPPRPWYLSRSRGGSKTDDGRTRAHSGALLSGV